MNNNPISFVVVVRNDLAGFGITCNSIILEAKSEDRLIIVDGSDSDEIIIFLKNLNMRSELSITMLRDEKKGVFAAQNLGISYADNWVCVINSGDILDSKARLAIDDAIVADPHVQCHVFSQYAFDPNGLGYKFIPDPVSLWPHQSIVMHKSIHDQFGYYRTDFKYSAEQYFFAQIRKNIIYKIHNIILTKYLLGGLSHKVDYNHCREQYMVRRMLGKSVLISIWLSTISPAMRAATEAVLGRGLAIRIKLAIKKGYSKS
jgi:hypothetical protein